MKILISFVFFILMPAFHSRLLVLVEPPLEANHDDLLAHKQHYPLGQIVKTDDRQLYIIRAIPDPRCEGFNFDPRRRAVRLLNAEETVIYNRIRSRRPTSPEDYRIPQVFYIKFDKILRRSGEIPSVKMVGIAGGTWKMLSCRLRLNIRTQHLTEGRSPQPGEGTIPTEGRSLPTEGGLHPIGGRLALSGESERPVLIHPEEGDLLMRSGEPTPENPRHVQHHFATYRNNMWVVKELLPRGGGSVETKIQISTRNIIYPYRKSLIWV